MELLERSEHLSVLATAAAEAAAGRGSVVLVEGEPGLGKTSLVQEFAARLQGSGRVLWGSCDDLTVPRPLSALVGLAGDVSDDLSRSLAAGRERGEVAGVILRELGAVPGPTVLVLEDVHWADEATLDLVTVVGRRIDRLPAMLVLTFRPGEAAPGHPLHRALGAMATARSHHLQPGPLSHSAVVTLAGEDADRVYALTGGNPFYVTELLGAGNAELPPSVANAVLGRVSRLSVASRRLVELVAMVPARIETRLLDEVMAEWAVAAEEPERRGLLQVAPDTVSFRHELARAAIRSSVPVSRRRHLHRGILDALVATDADPADVVHHAEQAGAIDIVAQTAPVAARQAARLGAHREAHAHFRRATELCGGQPLADQALLYEELATAAYLVDRLEEAFAAIAEAASRYERLPDERGLGRCLRVWSRLHWYAGDGPAARDKATAAIGTLEPLGETRELATAYGTMAQLEMLASNVDEALRWADRAIEIATRSGDDVTRAHALVTRGIARALAAPDDTDPLLEAFEEADRIGEHHEATRALLGLADHLFTWVRPAEAWEANQRALAYAAEHQVDALESFLAAMAAWHRLRLGDWEAAEELAVSEAARGPSVTQLLARTVLAELAVRRGDPDAAQRLAEVTEQAEATRELQWVGPTLELQIEWALLQGRALPVDHVIAVRATIAPNAWDTAYGARLTGWTALAGESLPFDRPLPEPHAAMVRGDVRSAAAAFQVRGWEYDGALLLSLLDDPAALGDALEVARRLGARPLEVRIVGRLRALGHRVPRGPVRTTQAIVAGLTARELEVLQLVARQFTNVEIGERLHISSRTAEHHVSALLVKLDVTTRREATRRAVELGLLEPA